MSGGKRSEKVRIWRQWVEDSRPGTLLSICALLPAFAWPLGLFEVRYGKLSKAQSRLVGAAPFWGATGDIQCGLHSATVPLAHAFWEAVHFLWMHPRLLCLSRGAFFGVPQWAFACTLYWSACRGDLAECLGGFQGAPVGFLGGWGRARRGRCRADGFQHANACACLIGWDAKQGTFASPSGFRRVGESGCSVLPGSSCACAHGWQNHRKNRGVMFGHKASSPRFVFVA